jgi:hypothetical protein
VKQAEFPHASPLSRRLIHTSFTSEKEVKGTTSSQRLTNAPEYIILAPDSLLPLECH